MEDITHYRYERYYGISENDYKINLIKYKTSRETNHGYWIIDGYKERFVLKKSRRRFAYPTKEEAFESFKIRTKKSLNYASRDVENAKKFIELCKDFDVNKSEKYNYF